MCKVKFLILAIILNLGIQVNAQIGFGSFNELPLLSSGTLVSSTNSSSLIPTNGLYVYYIDTNLVNGSVSDWIDVIQTNHATQTIGGKQPLMTSTGLTFTASQALVFTNLSTLTVTSYVWAIYATPDGGGVSLQVANGNFSFTASSGGARSFWRTFLNGTGTFTLTGFIPTNHLQIICSGITSNSFSANYTNGVLDPTENIHYILYAVTNIGFNGPFVLREFAVYTNSFVSPTIASNLNAYKLLKYGP